jgi:hypothetical protein
MAQALHARSVGITLSVHTYTTVSMAAILHTALHGLIEYSMLGTESCSSSTLYSRAYLSRVTAIVTGAVLDGSVPHHLESIVSEYQDCATHCSVLRSNARLLAHSQTIDALTCAEYCSERNQAPHYHYTTAWCWRAASTHEVTNVSVLIVIFLLTATCCAPSAAHAAAVPHQSAAASSRSSRFKNVRLRGRPFRTHTS